LLGLAERDGVGDFVGVLEEAEVFERGGGVGKELGIDDGAVLTRGGGCDSAMVAEILRTGSLRARRSLPEEKR
jgi:hypothetical protein